MKECKFKKLLFCILNYSITSNYTMSICLQVAGDETLTVQAANTEQVTMETRQVTTTTKISSHQTAQFQEYATSVGEPTHDTKPSETSPAQAYSYTRATQTLASAQWRPPVTLSPWQPGASPRPPPTTSVTWYYHPHFWIMSKFITLSVYIFLAAY